MPIAGIAKWTNRDIYDKLICPVCVTVAVES